MVTVPVKPDLVAVVDDEDAELVLGLTWHVSKRKNQKYAKAWFKDGLVYMHRLVMGFPEADVDHRDDDGLNNCKANLRVATRAQNIHRKRSRPGRSGYRGVYARKGKWVAEIQDGDKRRWLGTYATPAEAGRAYDEAAVRIYGEFARLNRELVNGAAH